MMSSPPASTAPSFPREPGRTPGYDVAVVDEFLTRARQAFEGRGEAMSAADIRTTSFPLARHGYRTDAVDAALIRLEDVLATRERDVALAHGGADAWVDRARSRAQEVLNRLTRDRGHRFDRVGVLHYGYHVDEVDLVADKLAGFLADGTPVTPDQVRTVAFRMRRGGYREAQVDAVLDAVIDVMLAVR